MHVHKTACQSYHLRHNLARGARNEAASVKVDVGGGAVLPPDAVRHHQRNNVGSSMASHGARPVSVTVVLWVARLAAYGCGIQQNLCALEGEGAGALGEPLRAASICYLSSVTEG